MSQDFNIFPTNLLRRVIFIFVPLGSSCGVCKYLPAIFTQHINYQMMV